MPACLRFCAAVVALTCLHVPAAASGTEAVLRLDTPMSPPAWALLERELLRANAAA